MEKRAFPRYPLVLDALVDVWGQGPLPCQIRDFCLGGLFLSLSAAGGAAPAAPVTIDFQVGEAAGIRKYRLRGQVARAFGGGLGIAFDEPDPAALLALQRVAGQSSRDANGPVGSGGATRGRSAPGSGTADPKVMTAYRDYCAGRFASLIGLMPERVGSELMVAARDAGNDRDQARYFDAMNALDGAWEGLIREFNGRLVQGLDHPVPTEAGGAGEVEGNLDGSGLMLLDKDEFEDFLVFADMAARAEDRLREPLAALALRLATVYRRAVDVKNNPLGPDAVCRVFGRACQDLELDSMVRRVVYRVFDATVVGALGDLYAGLTRLLDEAGVASLPAPDPASLSGARGPAAPRNRAGRPSAGPAPGASPPPASQVETLAAQALAPQAAAGRHLEPAPHSAAAPAPGAVQAHVPEATLPTAAGPAQAGVGDPYMPAAVAGSPPSGVAPAPYPAVTTLMGLHRRAAARAQATLADPTSTMDLMPWDNIQEASPVYSQAELDAALRELRPAPGDERDLKAQLLDQLSRSTPGFKRLANSDGEAIDVVQRLFASLGRDSLAAEQLGPRLKRMQLPLQRLALNDHDFMQNASHPARRLLDRLAEIAASGAETDPVWEDVDPIIERLTEDRGTGQEAFADAARALEDLAAERERRYADNVQRLVKSYQDQEAFLRQRRAGRQPAPSGKGPPGDTEWPKWSAQAKRLQVGDVVSLRDRPGRTPSNRLAWVGEQDGPYVFVDGNGEKSADFSLQELVMLLRRGLIQTRRESETPFVDRAMFDLLQGMHEEIAGQATRDPVTGLGNRKQLEARLRLAHQTAVSDKAEHVLCHLNLDHFKVINDACGREAGDSLLEAVGEVLLQCAPDALLARLGADAFGLLLEHTSGQQGRETAEVLRKAVAGYRFKWRDRPFPLTASIGLVCVSADGAGAETLLERAASACHAAKDSGRDRVKAYATEDLDVQRREAIQRQASLLNATLDAAHIRLRCQRIEPVAVGGGDKPHYEILLGLIDEDGRPVSPTDFVTAAEYYEKMPQLDRLVIRSALRWMGDNRELLKDLSGCSINLSGQTLSDETLTDFVIAQLTETRVPPGKVCFEVTETAAVAVLSNAEAFVRSMGDFGCRFSLDDFGTGHSSYSYLRQLPFDYVKIDGLFVKELPGNVEDYAVVKSITEIAHAMGKKTIAEYVENEQVLQALREIGVDFAQGYGVERPVYLDELKPPGQVPRQDVVPATRVPAPPADALVDSAPAEAGEDLERTLRF